MKSPLESLTPCSSATTNGSNVRVQFLDAEAKTGVVVACHTTHPGGMLAPLVEGLTSLDLEVHQIESRLCDGVRSERLLVAAADGQPLSQRRQGLLRTAVFNAMDSMKLAVANKNTHDVSELNAG